VVKFCDAGKKILFLLNTHGSLHYKLVYLSGCVNVRHGAHNWEGPGALTALTALSQFSLLTHSHAWIKQKASAEHVIFAGNTIVTYFTMHAYNSYEV